MPSRTCTVSLAPAVSAVDSSAASRSVKGLTVETGVNERGFFQFLGVRPGHYVVTAREDGLAPAWVGPIEVREDLESTLRSPLVLSEAATLALAIQPAISPFGYPWRAHLARLDPATGRMLAVEEKTADMDGHTTWIDLTPGTYKLLLEDAVEDSVMGGLGARWHDEMLELSEGDNLAPIVVSLVEIEGTVHLGDEPLETAIWIGGRSGERRFHLTSNSAGEFAGYLSREGPWPVELEWPDSGQVLRISYIDVTEDKDGVAEVEIQVPGGLVRGRVVDEQGRRVSHATVSASSLLERGRSSTVHSDVEGEFVFFGLPEGGVALQAEGPSSQSESVVVRASESTEALETELILRKLAKLKGIVVSDVGPVAGAEVLVWPVFGSQGGSAWIERAITSAEGRFALDVSSSLGAINAVARAPGYALRLLQQRVDTSEVLTISVGRGGGSLSVSVEEQGLGRNLLLRHEGVNLPLVLLHRFAPETVRANGEKLTIEGLEPGSYEICLLPDYPKSTGNPGSCAAGFLPSQGTLSLRPQGRPY